MLPNERAGRIAANAFGRERLWPRTHWRRTSLAANALAEQPPLVTRSRKNFEGLQPMLTIVEG
jgi:hypothetical protein